MKLRYVALIATTFFMNTALLAWENLYINQTPYAVDAEVKFVAGGSLRAVLHLNPGDVALHSTGFFLVDSMKGVVHEPNGDKPFEYKAGAIGKEGKFTIQGPTNGSYKVDQQRSDFIWGMKKEKEKYPTLLTCKTYPCENCESCYVTRDSAQSFAIKNQTNVPINLTLKRDFKDFIFDLQGGVYRGFPHVGKITKIVAVVNDGGKIKRAEFIPAADYKNLSLNFIAQGDGYTFQVAQ